jgi:2-oxoglutarate dehydrogenase E1 component
MAERREVDGLNAGYAQLLLDDYLENPASVPPEWRALFERGDSPLFADHPGLARLLETVRDGNGHAAVAEPAPADTAAAAPTPAPATAPTAADEELVAGVAAAMALVKAYRTHGHLAAHLDPLGSEPPGDPALDPMRYEPKLTPELEARIPAGLLRLSVEGETLADAIEELKDIYCGTIAYEIEHIADHEERVWLRWAIESKTFRQPLPPEDRKLLLARLSEVEGLEVFLRKRFLGQKQFSLEGVDVLVPMLDEAISLAAEGGAHEIALGMAHRGRLNVLAHTIGRPYETILREFEGERTIAAVAADPEGGTGDVKYHLGARGVRRTKAGEITVTLSTNPSHLEAVDPVVEGITRAKQTDRSRAEAVHEPAVAMPILLHGDASFAAQGVVAETFNLSALTGYSTGGTLHVIVNNQVGFTTDPADGRSTRYASDLAKGFDVPIIHVNADDPEAAVSAIRLAMAYRSRFGRDVVIDLVGYRRHGHNEQDEPAYTQPLMSERIDRQPPVRQQYAERVAEAGDVSPEEADALVAEVQKRLQSAHENLKSSFEEPQKPASDRTPSGADSGVDTRVAEERLRQLNEGLLAHGDDFTVHPKLAKQLERRRATLDEGGIEWGQAESLAFASLLVEGIPVRLTGQDTERGTFSHRHLVLHDAETGEQFTPIQCLEGVNAAFEVHNSPLSELAALGFEYGYSVAAGEALVLWEAQYGDFVNGAQVIIDQFMVSGLSKWRQTSRLTLLLPHGYEGNGPEHSSARLERFLSLAAQENVRVVNCTTAAQYFHVLRRQALDPKARPLIVMTPKGLLRLREATSTLPELTEGGFQPVIDDPGRPDKEAIRRLAFCSGKLYYDLVGHEDREQAREVAIARLEQLYPFPLEAARRVVEAYPGLEEVVWAQEEPQNMGAWRTIRHRLEEVAGRCQVRYIGRPWRASPSEGYPTAHLVEQDRIVRETLNF